MVQYLKLCLIIFTGSIFLIACGGEGDHVSAPKSQPDQKKDMSKPAIAADVVGIKLGMLQEDIRKKLLADGFEVITDRKRAENIPGADPIEYSETIHFKRERQDGADYIYEVLGSTAYPLPNGEARTRYITFSRYVHAQPVRGSNYIADAKTVTTEYSTSTLALMKKKYGEPFEVNEGACTGRSGTTTTSVPIFEANYYPDVRVYQGRGGLQVKIADTCRQAFTIRIEDTDYGKYLRNEFDQYAQKMLEKASSSTNKKVDF